MSLHLPGNRSRGSLLAFVVGVTTAVIVGGYFLFGPKGHKNRMHIDRWLKRARFAILNRMETIENITEQQYYTIVDEVVEGYGKLRAMSQEKIEKGKESFRQRWQEMREAAQRARDEARAELEEDERQHETQVGINTQTPQQQQLQSRQFPPPSPPHG